MITQYVIQRELNRIAFFIQHSGLFDEFPPKIRNGLDSLPIEWEKVDPKKDNVTDVIGKLNDHPIAIRIIRDEKRNEYQVFYLKKKYQVNSLDKLKITINALHKGEKPKPQVMQEFYDTLFTQKKGLYTQTMRHYLYGVSDKEWHLDIKKDVGHIYIRFYVDTTDDKEKEYVMKRLEEHQNYRIGSLINYLKNLAKELKLDISNMEFSGNFIKMADQAGIIITIK